MSEPSTYTLPPRRTLEEVVALEAFIRARVTPLRDADQAYGDEYKAFLALLDLTTVLIGGAEVRAEAGESLDMLHFYLYTAACKWRSHPDWLPEWSL